MELTSQPSVTYAYDNNGNVTSKIDSSGTTTYYSWDFEDRLTRVTLGGSQVNFKYDRWDGESRRRPHRNVGSTSIRRDGRARGGPG
ncbi:MAG: hypothetical protein DMG12_11230 [Acidobacteria bacterium]|nr:MAG: hypothetical protein DMG12_11230 [Acidobacteriota bacterium]